jgi:RNA recognition motif-containing protein
MKKPKASNKTLRMGNISDETSPKDLRKSFSEYGPVSTVQIHSENPNKVSASLVMFWDDAETHLTTSMA